MNRRIGGTKYRERPVIWRCFMQFTVAGQARPRIGAIRNQPLTSDVINSAMLKITWKGWQQIMADL